MARKSVQQLWEDISSRFVNFVENLFFNLGVIVAKNPWKTVTITWVFVILSCIGLLNFHIEKNPMKLWIPPESDYYYDTNWLIEHFEKGARLQKILITADNVLDSTVLVTLKNISDQISAIEFEHNNETYTINNLCLKVPIINGKKRKIRSADITTDTHIIINSTEESNILRPFIWLTDILADGFHCDVLDSLDNMCLRYNILDMWNNDINLIKNVTNQEIIKKFNQIKINPITGHKVDYSKLLGGVEYDNDNNIISAKSILITWYMEVNMTAVDLNEVGNLVGTEDWVSIPLAIWERKFLNILSTFTTNLTHAKLFYEAGCSFADWSGQAMFSDLDKLSIGIILMFIYIQFAISRCNWIQIKLTLGSVGLLCVGMAYITSVGWCSVLNVSFGPVHSSLPFLLMGLGVDDMFVMNACWNNLSTLELKSSLPVKIGLMLKHAGVSIVITSFTDIVALLIGAITILPSLKSFCIYAAVGVFFIFCYSVTFFVAIFTLDVRRVESKRNCLLFCYKHKSDIVVTHEQTIFQKMLEKLYKHVIFSLAGKVIVVIFSVIMTGFSISAILQLEQRFDPKWFIPEGSSYKDYLDNHEHYYPNEGQTAMVLLGEMDYKHEFVNLINMGENLKNETYIEDFSSWLEPFYDYSLKYRKIDFKKPYNITEHEFSMSLSNFLFSEHGARFQQNIRFSQNFSCGYPATNITASSMSFKFLRFNGPEEYIPAMNHVKNIVKSTNISTGDGYLSVWSKVFSNWVTDEIISVEVERNIELALLCVMLCTVVLITNLQMCFWIFMCVLLTLVYVLGWMQRWGMTVDIVCCIGLELAIGLCVDYAAHVGHTFLTNVEGNRAERALKTVTSIGSAVLLGGGSTLLSLSLLSSSKAYTFQSFFKIFLLVIIFGLFNGLVLLPVILSLIGPDPYKPKVDKIPPIELVETNGTTGAQTRLHNLNKYEIIRLTAEEHK